MRVRRSIGLLAIICVLVHAAAIARHHAMVLDAHLQHGDLVTQLALICHASGGSRQLPASDVPYVPPPSNASGDCPLCMGLHATVAILPADDCGSYLVLDGVSERIVFVGELIRPRLVHCWPPSRGPPLPT